jgi:uncharacterized protein with NRDE domain
MCIAVIAWQSHPDYPLILASNRDEFYTRSTRPAAWWGQSVSLLAGRDEEAGGTWLGINRNGRVALVTNVRAPTERNPHAPSRGALVVAALQAGDDVGPWLQATAQRTQAYNGFNLLVGDALPLRSGRRITRPRLHYFSNRLDAAPSALAPGIYGLSNGFLDTPWPKVVRSVGAFATRIAQDVDAEALFALLADRELAHDSSLPQTGVPQDWERALSAVQIRANGYGTRASTVITVRRDGVVRFVERSFDPAAPEQFSDRSYEYVVPSVAPVPSDFDIDRH